jgi:hypothetical protein
MRHRFLLLLLAAALAPAVPAAAANDPAIPRSDRPAAKRPRVWLIGGPRTFLGVTTLDITPELRAFYGAPKEEGVVVSSVAPESPAAAAGVKVGDVITRVDGHPVASPWELADELGGHKKGDRVALDVVRDRSSRKLEATLAQREEPEMEAEREMVRGFRGPMLALPKMAQFDQMLKTPEWQGRLESLDECERVRKRLEAVEERLKALEQKLPGH